jgi:hypothetical protein
MAGIEQGFAAFVVNAIPQQEGTSAELLFDSCLQTGSAGIRSGIIGLRQMLYRADPYQIDLQLEGDREHNRLVVVGQLVDVSQPEVACFGIQVTISNLREKAVNTATNQFGEFSGEVENSGNLELSFLDQSGKRIVILLRGAVE